MMPNNMKARLNPTVQEVFDVLTHKQNEMLNLIYSGFLKHKKQLLKNAAQNSLELRWELRKHTLRFNDPNLPQEERARLTALVHEFLGMMSGLDKMWEAVEVKVNEGILFSEKAVVEIKDIIKGVEEIIISLHDLVLTENRVLSQHIITKGDYYQSMIRQFNTEHEERLIRGICMPKSSIIYIKMSTAIEEIIYHAKAFARKIG